MVETSYIRHTRYSREADQIKMLLTVQCDKPIRLTVWVRNVGRGGGGGGIWFNQGRGPGVGAGMEENGGSCWGGYTIPIILEKSSW